MPFLPEKHNKILATKSLSSNFWPAGQSASVAWTQCWTVSIGGTTYLGQALYHYLHLGKLGLPHELIELRTT